MNTTNKTQNNADIKAHSENRLSKENIFTIPNLMSLFRILLIPFIIWFYCFRNNYRAAVGLILLSSATDIADGIVARKFNMISDLGKLLDPIADKMTQGAMICCLCARYSLMFILIAIFVLKEIAMFLLGYYILRYTDTVNSSRWFGKACTVILESSIMILVLFPEFPVRIANGIIIACIVAIISSFSLYVNFYMNIFKQHSVKICKENKKVRK